MRADISSRGRTPNGASLVELMIGLVVGLLVSLAALGSLRVFSNVQRQGAVAGSSVLNAVSALDAIKSDVAVAGLGFFDGRLPLCDRLNLGLGANRLFNGAAFAPLRIVRTAGSDQLDVFYASDVAGGASLPLVTSSDGSSVQTLSAVPAAEGQVTLLSPAATGLCTVRSVTAITPGTPDTPQRLAFDNTGAYNQVNFTTAPVYAANARITLLGTLVWHRYRVDSGNLLLEQPLLSTSAVLVRNVIGMRAEYGVSAAGGSTLESWQDAGDAGWNTLTSANIGQVRALRLGVVVRSPQRDKTDASGRCTTTDTKPTLFGVAVEPDVSDWQCFRFRSATLVVPLRNLVWGQLR